MGFGLERNSTPTNSESYFSPLLRFTTRWVEKEEELKAE